ncbi:MAG TPA: SRPBCC domain-containing protein [Nitrososphaerales archaeon]|nr:SRPBCC domain-containing protein [Nitrososphaerales archaeon]
MKREEFGPAGAVLMEGEKATLVFRRRLAHPPDAVWKALTDPSELSNWYMTKAVIDGREGGTIDLMAGPSRLHVTGRILTWKPPVVFEHEWKVAPRAEIPSGEDAIIRWELRRDGEGTILHLEHRKLNRETALGFAPGTHAFIDRLEAQLGGLPLPNWQDRYKEVAGQYPPSWVSRQG